MISKTDISITFYYKNYFELNSDEKAHVDKIYASHETLKEKARKHTASEELE